MLYNMVIKLKEDEVLKMEALQLMTNLVMAEDLLNKAKKELSEGKEIDVKNYNKALKYVSKFILESRI